MYWLDTNCSCDYFLDFLYIFLCTPPLILNSSSKVLYKFKLKTKLYIGIFLGKVTFLFCNSVIPQGMIFLKKIPSWPIFSLIPKGSGFSKSKVIWKNEVVALSIWLKSDLYLRYHIEDLITLHYWSCSCELCINFVFAYITSWFQPIR